MGNNSNHLLLFCSLFPSRELKNQFRGFFCLLFENLFRFATSRSQIRLEGKHFCTNKKTIFFISSKASSRCKSFKALLEQQWRCLQPWYIALAYEWNYIWRWRWIIHGVWKLGKLPKLFKCSCFGDDCSNFVPIINSILQHSHTQLKNSFTFAVLAYHLPSETVVESDHVYQINSWMNYLQTALEHLVTAKQLLKSRKAYRFLQILSAASLLSLKPLSCSGWKIHRSYFPAQMNTFERFMYTKEPFHAFSLSAAPLPHPTIVLMMNVYGATLFSHLSFLPRQLHIKQFHNWGLFVYEWLFG